MKYVMDGLLQSKILEFKLTQRETKLLDFMKNINAYPKTHRMEIKGELYFWINYEAFLKEYPALYIPNTKQVGEHIKKLKQKGLIKLHVDKRAWGSFTYICFTELYFTLLSDNPTNYLQSEQDILNKKQDEPMNSNHSDLDRSGDGIKSEWVEGKIGVGRGENRSAYINNNPSTIINSNIIPFEQKETKNKIKSNKQDESLVISDQVMEIVNYFDEVNKTKTNTTTKSFAMIAQKFEKILQEFTVEQIRQVIDFARKDEYHSKYWNNLTTLSWPTKFIEKHLKATASTTRVKTPREALKELTEDDYSGEF